MNSLPTCLPKRQRGYNLIEVLVALFVLSIGMLGVASMFLGTMQDSRSANYRSKAAAFAWDMAERIRANRIAASAYIVGPGPAGTDGSCSETPTNATAVNCDNNTLAAHDIFEWKTALASREIGLPGGDGTVAQVVGTPPQYTISVMWTEGDGAPAQTVQVVTQL